MGDVLQRGSGSETKRGGYVHLVVFKILFQGLQSHIKSVPARHCLSVTALCWRRTGVPAAPSCATSLS